MEQNFESAFRELQNEIVSVCLEYVSNQANQIYIYCSYENGLIFGNCFYRIDEYVTHKHLLNELPISSTRIQYDVSRDRQKKLVKAIVSDIDKIKTLFDDHVKQMPTEMKLIYYVATDRLEGSFRYDYKIGGHATKTANDLFEEWFEELQMNR